MLARPGTSLTPRRMLLLQSGLWIPVGLGLLMLLAPLSATRDEGKPREITLRVGKRKVTYQFYGTRLGVLLAESAVADKHWGQAMQVGDVQLRPSQKLMKLDRAFVFDLPRQFRETQIHAMASRIKRSYKGVRYAGPLVRVKGIAEPGILSEELIVRFKPDITPDEKEKIEKDSGVAPVRRLSQRFPLYQYRAPDPTKSSVLTVAEKLQQNESVLSSSPHIVYLYPQTSDSGEMPISCKQWHHHNPGDHGEVDADIDTRKAWKFTKGKGRVIAVVDIGFDAEHRDLKPNLWRNIDEIPNNGKDDDGNGCKDDVHGWNFICNRADLTSKGPHGTRAAGCAASRGIKPHRIRGSAPRAHLMLLCADTQALTIRAVAYALSKGADVIVLVRPLNVDDGGLETILEESGTFGRCGRGCVAVYAMRYSTAPHNQCVKMDLSASPYVIAVARSSAQDQQPPASIFSIGVGDCMDLMAPGLGDDLKAPHIVTTDKTGSGMGTACPHYHTNFRGTSASSPITGGVAALILAVRSDLRRDQVQWLLQDTCDKIDTDNAQYDLHNGFSTKASGSSHAYGRINAFEAVRLVAGRIDGGRGGTDLLLRDNRFDWGNTEQPSTTKFNSPRGTLAYWETPDLKIDAPPYQPLPKVTSETFDCQLSDEPPLAGKVNRIYVRIRNRGPIPAKRVTIQLFEAIGSVILPSVGKKAVPGNPVAPVWSKIGEEHTDVILYSGCSAARDASSDPAKVLCLPWTPPANGANQSYAILAMVHADQDPIHSTSGALANLVPTDNNMTLKNVVHIDSAAGNELQHRFPLQNNAGSSKTFRLSLKLPEKWQGRIQFVPMKKTEKPRIVTESLTLKAGEKGMVVVKIQAPKKGVLEPVRLLAGWKEGKHKIQSGITYLFAPRKKP